MKYVMTEQIGACRPAEVNFGKRFSYLRLVENCLRRCVGFDMTGGDLMDNFAR